MGYRKAEEILPVELIQLIQQYVDDWVIIYLKLKKLHRGRTLNAHYLKIEHIIEQQILAAQRKLINKLPRIIMLGVMAGFFLSLSARKAAASPCMALPMWGQPEHWLESSSQSV